MTPPFADQIRWRLVLRLAVAVMLVAVGLTGLVVSAQPEQRVYVAEITGTIDLGLAPYLNRVLDRAEEEDAAVLLVIDTPGGRLDAVLEMRRALLDTDARTIAFVDRTALSAGALIAISSEEIHLAPGAVMGAATPVTGSGDPAGEKTISAVRAVFRSTAETRGRDPLVAEAMVDPEVEIPGLVAAGELLTLSVPQATAAGYADEVVGDLNASLAQAGLEAAEVVPTSPSPAEAVVRWLTNPLVASLLLTGGIWLVIGDVLVGGVGIPAAAGLGLIGLFFWGHLLAGLAGWEDVVLVIIGLALIALEVLVIPGTGIAGILGLAAFLGGAFLAMLSRDLVTGEQVQRALTTVAGSFLLIVTGTVALFAYLARGGGPRGLVLQERVGVEGPIPQRGWTRWLPPAPAESPPAPDDEEVPSLEGAAGIAITDLRPGGMAQIDGRRIDVVTDGEFLPEGTELEVVSDQGYRRVVRAVRRDG